MLALLESCFKDGTHMYNAFLTLIIIILIIYGMYTNIRYSCLKKATEKVAEVEKMEDLTGEQKFAMVVLWIEDELPKIFKNELIKNILKKLVQIAYDNSSSFAKNYIKRKTGYDISELLNNLSVTSYSIHNESNSDTSTDN